MDCELSLKAVAIVVPELGDLRGEITATQAEDVAGW
jgi:hypothetical protein